jgi:hypothetical protein
MTPDPNRTPDHPPLPPVPEKFQEACKAMSVCLAASIQPTDYTRLMIGSVMAELWRLEELHRRWWIGSMCDASLTAAINADAWRRWAGLEVERG